MGEGGRLWIRVGCLVRLSSTSSKRISFTPGFGVFYWVCRSPWLVGVVKGSHHPHGALHKPRQVLRVEKIKTGSFPPDSRRGTSRSRTGPICVRRTAGSGPAAGRVEGGRPRGLPGPGGGWRQRGRGRLCYPPSKSARLRKGKERSPRPRRWWSPHRPLPWAWRSEYSPARRPRGPPPPPESQRPRPRRRRRRRRSPETRRRRSAATAAVRRGRARARKRALGLRRGRARSGRLRRGVSRVSKERERRGRAGPERAAPSPRGRHQGEQLGLPGLSSAVPAAGWRYNKRLTAGSTAPLGRGPGASSWT